MALQNTDSLSLQRIPYVTVEIVVASKEVSSADGESYGSNAAQNVVVCVLHEFLVRTNIEETARRVVRPSTEAETVREIPVWFKYRRREIVSVSYSNLVEI